MVGLTSVGAGQLSTEMGGKVQEMSTDVERYGEVGACLYFTMVSFFQLKRKRSHQWRSPWVISLLKGHVIRETCKSLFVK